MKKTITLLMFAVFLLSSSAASAQWYNPGWWNLDSDDTIDIGTMDDGLHIKVKNLTFGNRIPWDSMGADYHFAVDWGDGSNLERFYAQAGEPVQTPFHLYQTDGEFIVKILPLDLVQVSPGNYVAEYKTFPRIDFSDSSSIESLIEIIQWGVVKFKTFENSFQDCINLVSVPSSGPIANGSMSFKNIFNGATQLNSTLGGWDISNVTNMEGALDGTGLDVYKYNNTLAGWAIQGQSFTLGAAGLLYCDQQAHDALTNSGWTIVGDTYLECVDCLAPTNLSVFEYDVNGSSVTFSWDHPDPSQTEWELYAGVNPNTPSENPGNLNIFSGPTYKTFNGFPSNTQFYVWIRSNCDAFGVSPWSSRLTVYTPPSCIAPSEVIITDVSNQTAIVTPTQGSDETSYEYRVWNADANFNQISSTTTNSTEWIILPLTPDTNYIVYVKAICDGNRGESVETPSRLFKTRPTNPVPGDLCSNSIFLSDVSNPYNGNTNGAYHDYSQDCLPGGTSDLLGKDKVYIISVPNGSGITMNHTSNFNSISRAAFGTNSNCPGDVLIRCGDSQAMSQVTWVNTTGSSKIFYWVESGDGTETGTFTLDWTIAPQGIFPLTSIPDPNFEAYLEANYMGNGIANDQLVYTQQINAVTTLDVSNQFIADLTGIEDFTALTTLKCQVNYLETLDLSSNTNLTTLWASENDLTSLNLGYNTNYLANNGLLLTGNPELVCVTANDPDLAMLWNLDFFEDGSGNTTLDPQIVFGVDCLFITTLLDPNFEQALIERGFDRGPNDGFVYTSNIQDALELDVSNENISNLAGIEDFTNLESFDCTNNPLTSLNVSQNEYLISLNIFNSLISELDLTQNSFLEELTANLNPQLTSLDLSQNSQLIALVCSNNSQLTSINLNNGNNFGLDSPFLFNNPSLTCVQVDDVAYATEFWTSITNSAVYNTYCEAFDTSTTDIPDPIFEAYLETHDASGALVALGASNSMGNGIANDNLVLTSRISGVTDLNINNQNISDLTGIEDFESLSVFACIFNQITSINLNQNLNLTYLECGYNNQLTSLDVTQCSNLETLRIYNSTITELDISENLNLTYLVAGGAESQLTSLDASQNTNLTNFYVSDSPVLTSLNLKNGNNTFVIESYLPNNPNLTCVQVDDVAYSTEFWTAIDDISVFSDFCVDFYMSVPDVNFEAYLETRNAIGAVVPLGDPTSMGNGIANDGYVTTNRISGVTNLNISNKNISNLTGIEGFTSLSVFYCGNNQIPNINLPQNLRILNVSNNPISSIEVAQYSNLENLSVGGTQIIELDVSQNLNLTSLEATNIPLLTSLDLSQNTNLLNLNAPDGNFETINLKNGNNTLFNTIYMPDNPNLTCVQVDDVAYATANFTFFDDPSVFSDFCIDYYTSVPDVNFEAYLEANGMGNGIANDGYVTTLNISNIPLLNIYGQNISDLTGIEAFTVLEDLDVGFNQLTTLDVSQNLALRLLYADDNQLTSLNIKNGNNLNFGRLWTDGNPDLTCIEVDTQTIVDDWNTGVNLPESFNKDAQTAFSNNCGEVTLEAKAYLQGAFMNPNTGEETLMRDDLRTLVDFPLTSPYGDGLTITPTELAVSGPDAIVDWIWVELRDDVTNTIIIAAQSALLQRDGDIVAIDGVSSIVFSQNAKHYNVVIKHRNHLGVMSSTRVPFPKDQVVDFQSGAMTSFGTNGQTSVSGIFTLWAGNVNNDGVIRFSGNNNDTNALKAFILANAALPLITFPVNGYYNSDIDLNGITKFSGADNDSNFIKASILNPVINPLGFLTTTISTQVPNN